MLRYGKSLEYYLQWLDRSGMEVNAAMDATLAASDRNPRIASYGGSAAH